MIDEKDSAARTVKHLAIERHWTERAAGISDVKQVSVVIKGALSSFVKPRKKPRSRHRIHV